VRTTSWSTVHYSIKRSEECDSNIDNKRKGENGSRVFEGGVINQEMKWSGMEWKADTRTTKENKLDVGSNSKIGCSSDRVGDFSRLVRRFDGVQERKDERYQAVLLADQDEIVSAARRASNLAERVEGVPRLGGRNSTGEGVCGGRSHGRRGAVVRLREGRGPVGRFGRRVFGRDQRVSENLERDCFRRSLGFCRYESARVRGIVRRHRLRNLCAEQRHPLLMDETGVDAEHVFSLHARRCMEPNGERVSHKGALHLERLAKREPRVQRGVGTRTVDNRGLGSQLVPDDTERGFARRGKVQNGRIELEVLAHEPDTKVRIWTRDPNGYHLRRYPGR